MKPLAAFMPMRARGMMKVIPPLPPLEPMRTVEEQQEKDDAKFAWWVSQVGEDRARIALSIFQEKTGSRTLPELLTEAYLRNQGARYVAQLNLGFSRPDFTVFGSPAAPQGALIIRCQGQHWHSSADAITRDQGQKDLLIQGTAQGAPITLIIDIWEKAIYQGDSVLDLAYHQGVELPQEN